MAADAEEKMAALSVSSATAACAAGKPARKLKEEGYLCSQLVEAGFKWGTSDGLFPAGYSRAELVAAGFYLEELKHTGCKAAGLNLCMLKHKGFTYDECRKAGYPKSQLESDFDICPKGGEHKWQMAGNDGSGHPTHTTCSKCSASKRA